MTRPRASSRVRPKYVAVSPRCVTARAAGDDPLVVASGDRVEVQVEVAAFGEAVAGHGGVERGEEPALAFVGEPVAVGRQRGGLGQRDEPGEQPGGGIRGEVVDVADPAGADEFERQERQDRAQCRDDAGAGVAGCADQAGQVERDQVGHGQEEPGQLRVRAGG
jgi:hypothetical protein